MGVTFGSRIVAAFATTAMLFFCASTAQARGTPSPAPIDCSQAGSMMEAKTAPPVAMTGAIDHDTAAAMKMHLSMMMQMANIELSCGKDPKMQAAAKKIMTDSAGLVDEIQRLSSPY